ncbi:MAG TPA: hypothetical protein VMF62_12410 [Acetobacteraceae bacterium]|jgi:hypothetical protein|nr:hypothetical protein [Acetobacteraceae bacterium]
MSGGRDGAFSRIALLEAVRREGKSWAELAPRYGVVNPEPPWKTSLDAMCESLAASGALPSLARREAEDALGESVYGRVPAPERQLLALVHTMLEHGLVDEAALARRMDVVRERLEAG